MMSICPHCAERFPINEYDTDALHQCNSGKPELDQEDVLMLDSWTEDGTTTTNGNPMLQGLANKLQHTDAGIRGGRDSDRNVRGKDVDVYRSRQHFEYIQLK